MMESDEMIEFERIGSSMLAVEVGETRRRERSIRGTTSRRPKRSIVDDLPSRTNLDSIGRGPCDMVDVSVQAAKIAEHLEHDVELTDDTVKSDKENMVKIKNMVHNLTMKRTIRRNLLQNIENRRKGNVSLARRLGYSITFASSHMRDSGKELLVHLEPWYQKLKTIEGHFGSGVATYFKFLRSLFFINLLVFIVSLIFVIIPQLLHVADGDVDFRAVNFSFGDLFTGEGYLYNSVLFYGYYTNQTIVLGDVSYKMPSAYFFSALVSYLLVFLLLSMSMAMSFRKNFVETTGSRKNIYSTKIFCAWDFGIATAETADLKSKSIHTELMELIEEQNVEKLKRTWRQWLYLWCMQISLNLLLFACLAIAAYFTWRYLTSDSRTVDTPTEMMISLIFTLVIHLAPIFLIWLLRFEDYGSPRTATYVTIFRTAFLDAVLIGVMVAYRLDSAEKGMVCWETALGQEIYRLVLLDFWVGLVATPLAQFIRHRMYLTIWPGIGLPEMDVARNTINLLYNEALFFIGLFFSPILSLVILIKLLMTFYIRYWGATNDCKPSSRMWRAAQAETVFLSTAFIAFILILVLYGYILSSVPTSTCGPFRGKKLVYDQIIDTLKAEDENSIVLAVILYVRKPGVVAFVLIILLLAVYYVWAIGKAQERVVGILQDALRIQADDKDFLLSLFAKLSRKYARGSLGTKFASELELHTPRDDKKRMRRSRSYLDIPTDGSPPKSTLKFNPVFTESEPRADYDPVALRMCEEPWFNPESNASVSIWASCARNMPGRTDSLPESGRATASPSAAAGCENAARYPNNPYTAFGQQTVEPPRYTPNYSNLNYFTKGKPEEKPDELSKHKTDSVTDSLLSFLQKKTEGDCSGIKEKRRRKDNAMSHYPDDKRLGYDFQWDYRNEGGSSRRNHLPFAQGHGWGPMSMGSPYFPNPHMVPAHAHSTPDFRFNQWTPQAKLQNAHSQKGTTVKPPSEPPMLDPLTDLQALVTSREQQESVDLRLPGPADAQIEKPVQLTVHRLDKEISSTNGAGGVPGDDEEKAEMNGFGKEEKPVEEKLVVEETVAKTEAPVLGTVANGETEALAPVVTRSDTPVRPVVTQSVENGEDHEVIESIKPEESPETSNSSQPSESLPTVSSTSTDVKPAPKENSKKKRPAKKKVKPKPEAKKPKILKPVKPVAERRGPVLHIRGTRDAPVSVSVLNGPKADEDDGSGAKRNVAPRPRDFRRFRGRTGLYSSTLSAQYDARTTDPNWVCVFCKQGPHRRNLGDLFGPYFVVSETQAELCDYSGDERDIMETQRRGGRNKKSIRANNLLDYFQNMSGKLKRSKSADLTQAMIGLMPLSDDEGESPRYEVWVHEACAVWSPSVCMVDTRLHGLQEAVWHCQKEVCSKCGLTGANIGCIHRNCPNRSHYACALDTGWTLPTDTFISTCHFHVQRT